METQDYTYAYTLDFFLKNSDEDVVDAQAVLAFLKEEALGMLPADRPSRWLDVGAGPATKVVRVLEGWRRELRLPTPTLRIIEPSGYWIEVAKRNLMNAGVGHVLERVFQETWESFLDRQRGGGEKFELVSFLHSVYGLKVSQSGLLERLSGVSSLLARGGWLCFAVESPSSDLFQLKLEVFPHLEYRLVGAGVLEATLRDFGWSFSRTEDLPQKFYLADSQATRDTALENSRAMAFIVQTTPDAYERRLSDGEIALVKDAVCKRLKRDAVGYYLSVPDRLYWTQCAHE